VVNGYQDDFDGVTLNPDWLEFDGGSDDGPLFTLTGGGTLLMLPASGDPNKLLYNPAAPYANGNNGVQEVLALIKVNSGSSDDNDGFRGGVAAAANTGSGQGINLHFRGDGLQGVTGEHFTLLNDAIAWGPSTAGPTDWAVGDYMWLRLRYLDDAGAGDDAFAKIWPGGLTPEPVAFNLSWNQADRSGLAGLVTNSVGGNGTFEVDYVLIKASGLPVVSVVPEPSSLMMLSMGGLLLLGVRRRAE
jgi:hypothetical protein